MIGDVKVKELILCTILLIVVNFAIGGMLHTNGTIVTGLVAEVSLIAACIET